ncbi:hypothetical protein SNE40_018159 [Patella caerulea]|uniref:DDE Tnp4 domain-containing protein n=1 Tax=Patella caerulea TaxID=87958 RepID=A0AAN8J770_PATCE
MKLRQAKEDLELSKSTVSQLINVWINFLYFQIKEINIWPEKSIVQKNMPSNFKSAFPTTRVVLDATEIPVSKPQNVVAQSMTFSTYKNKTTLKTIIGCSPRGLVSYLSDSYGGSASDRQIIERSTLVNNNMFESKDSIMADRGIMV